MPFLIQTSIQGRPHWNIRDGDEQMALKDAAAWVWLWGTAVFRKQCDAEFQQQVAMFYFAGRSVDAIELWHSHHNDPTLAIYEIEFIARECHHDVPTPARDKEHYLVESVLKGVGNWLTLVPTIDSALESVAADLRQWTSQDPDYGYPCDETLCADVRKLIREKRLADAIDIWMGSKPNPTVAIHKLRVLRKVYP